MSLFPPSYMSFLCSPLLFLRSCVDILLGWEVFGGFGLGFRDQKQRVLLAFFVKTDIY